MNKLYINTEYKKIHRILFNIFPPSIFFRSIFINHILGEINPYFFLINNKKIKYGSKFKKIILLIIFLYKFLYKKFIEKYYIFF
jgi:hypothetical protein